MGKKMKRRKIFIDPLFQYRFVKKVTLLALLVVTSSTVGTLFVLSLMKREVSQPDPFSDHQAVSLASLPDISWMLSHLWPYFLLGLALVAIISVLFATFESFRIAGPEYRMRQMLKSMRRGDFSDAAIPLRQHDELEKLYSGIMDVHGAWKGHVKKMQGICDADVSNDLRLQHLREILFSFKVGARH